MEKTEDILQDLREALRHMMEFSRAVLAKNVATQLALLSVVEQLSESKTVDNVIAADRIREMIGDFPGEDSRGLEEELSNFAERVSKIASREKPIARSPVEKVKLTLVS